MITHLKFLLISLTLIAATGCSNAVVSNLTTTTTPQSVPVTLAYALTQCNDAPWETYQALHADLTTEQSIQRYYLDTYQIALLSVVTHAAPAGFFSCQACGCATGERITVTVSADQAPQLLELGFSDQVIDPVPDNTTLEPATTNVTANTNLVDLNTVDDNATGEVVLTAEEAAADAVDQTLRDRAATVQSALATYNNEHSAYPDTLAQLNLTIDLTGLTYTPIGSTPANYYDLTQALSTGDETLNP